MYLPSPNGTNLMLVIEIIEIFISIGPLIACSHSVTCWRQRCRTTASQVVEVKT